MLHQHQIAERGSDLLNSQTPSENSTNRSILALKAIMRMTTQIAHEFNSNIQSFDVRSFPPCSLYTIGQVGLLHIKFGHEDVDEATTKQWRGDLDALRECLWWLGQRWLIALHHLETIDKACDFPLRRFEDIELPTGNLCRFC